MHVNRREFLRKSICTALGGVGLYSALGNLRLISSAAAARPYVFGDYKALVCIFLYGGNDSVNTIVPVSGQARIDYAALRGDLALPIAGLVPLTPVAGGGPANYGLHPAMRDRVGSNDGDAIPYNAGIGGLFNTGKAAIVANVGSLLYPITQSQFQNDSVQTPAQLFSHDDQTNQWQTSRPDDANANGWGGRIADLLHSSNTGALPMSMTLSGNNRFQRGAIVNPYSMDPSGVTRMSYSDDGPESWLIGNNDAGAAAYEALIAPGTQANIFERAFADSATRSIANYRILDAALGASPTWNTPFANTELGQQLQMVARLISIRSALGMSRQVFFVSAGNYDSHTEQLVDQDDNLSQLSQALRAFYDATAQLGVPQDVTAFTASDFGRSLAVNENGTDHGWGGHHFVVGGGVQGQRFYGAMPALTRYDDNNPASNPDDTGYGQVIPTIAVDQYAATLARWFGVDSGGIADIFPNLGRFPGYGGGNLGFMS
jgi:uncharacterized protein (DUF1501 family)